MPKKTKKEKILAELHRKLDSISSAEQLVKRQNHLVQPIIQTPATPAYIYEKESVAKPKTAVAASNFAHVIHDLIKITIFTIIALLLQGMLYFLLHRT